MYRIMIVDDEPLILAGIASLLNWEEYQCRIVGKALNGQQALSLLDTLQPDIVITDIKMPAMDGITFMKTAMKNGCGELYSPDEFGRVFSVQGSAAFRSDRLSGKAGAQ